MRIPRVILGLALLGPLVVGLLVRAPRARAAEACFAETGKCLRGGFLDYWLMHGGLAINGYPLSDERPELLEDGKVYTVQYFERVRLELHPENPPPYDVLLGQFGRRVARTGDRNFNAPLDTAPATPLAGQSYFAETGHNLGGGFRDYWLAHGGLAQFGYPITEEFEQRLDPSNSPATYRVQYFERARFELHPENQPPYDVLLGQFGRRILGESDALAGDRGFQLLYLTDERVQGQLGFVAGAVVSASGAYQGFERGAMLYQGDTPGRIYVFCGDERAGRSFGASRAFSYFPDTWDASQPAGGGPGPRPGLYEPRRGFGKVWRDNPAVRDCLGYATSPDELGYTIRLQGFGRGTMLSATTPTGRFIYAQYGGPGSYLYERYPDPAP